jgi:Do/DeqQ family serine protease
MRGKLLIGVVAVIAAVFSVAALGAQDQSPKQKMRGILSDILGTGGSVSAPTEIQRAAPETQAQLQYSFSPLVKKASPAVVNVYAERMVRQRSPFAGDPFFERFFGQRAPGRSQKQSSLGSGVIVDPSGIIVTNNHVIDGADEIKVAFADGREFSSRLLLKDERVDLAILKIEDDVDFATIGYSDSDRLEVGDIVLAIGNPFGVGQTVTSGIVSALARNGVGVSDFGFFIQTDAAINPGNSGGALIDMNGRLVGINTAIFSRSGGSNGIGFAIPANMVRAVVDAAKSGDDRFSRPYIGATFSSVTSDMAEALGMKQAFGAIVTAVVEGGPAHEGGLKIGDIVLRMNGLSVEHPDALGYRLATTAVGTSAEFEIVSRSKIKRISIKLGPPRQRAASDEIRITGKNPFSGALIADLGPKLAEEMRINASAPGVVVLDVEQGSLANRYGLRPRDIIVAINGETVSSTGKMVEIVATDPGFWRFEITRGGRRLRQMVR